MSSEFLIVAEKILGEQKRSMSAKELVDFAYKGRLFTDKISGKTPHQTMKAKLSVDIRRKGDSSIFVRTMPGKFLLRRLVDNPKSIYRAPPLVPPSTDEKVLVFPSKILDQFERFQGIRKNWRKPAKELLKIENCRYIPRLDAEGADDLKQVLTYVMVTRGPLLLAFNRGNYNRVEEFLRGSQCVGFGGHVTEIDRTLFSLHNSGIVNNAIRELLEEIKFPEKDKFRLLNEESLQIVGLLNDDSSSVGRRHFAVVFRYEVSDDHAWNSPMRGEKSITQLRWINPSDPLLSLRTFEYWSQLCLREYYAKEIHSQSSSRIIRKKGLKPPHVLCVLGAIGSGKTEATGILKRKFGYKEINSGRVLASILKVPPVPKTNRNEFQKLAWDFIANGQGPKLLAKAILEKVAECKGEKILIDGIRQKRTLQELKAGAGKYRIGLLFIHTPPDIAFKFYKKRTGKPLSIYDFLKIRDASVESEVVELIGMCDAVLYNWAGRTNYRKAIQELIQEIS